jgi:hypothetical protein
MLPACAQTKMIFPLVTLDVGVIVVEGLVANAPAAMCDWTTDGDADAAEVIVAPPWIVAAPLIVACANTGAAQSRIRLSSRFMLISLNDTSTRCNSR